MFLGRLGPFRTISPNLEFPPFFRLSPERTYDDMSTIGTFYSDPGANPAGAQPSFSTYFHFPNHPTDAPTKAVPFYLAPNKKKDTSHYHCVPGEGRCDRGFARLYSEPVVSWKMCAVHCSQDRQCAGFAHNPSKDRTIFDWPNRRSECFFFTYRMLYIKHSYNADFLGENGEIPLDYILGGTGQAQYPCGLQYSDWTAGPVRVETTRLFHTIPVPQILPLSQTTHEP